MTKDCDTTDPVLEIDPPFLTRFQCGNTGIDYLHMIDSGMPGPHAMITAIVHGNEFSGAIAIAELIDNPPKLKRGRLSLCFANPDACLQFDRKRPWHTRFIDEDMNRVWCGSALDGAKDSLELVRARDLRDTIDTVDYLLDLHSMAGDFPPVVLAGPRKKNRDFAEVLALGIPIVVDDGHRAGRRLRDYGAFDRQDSSKTALLVECGQHWKSKTLHMARKTSALFLEAAELVDTNDGNPSCVTPLVVQVTHTVTAETNDFQFTDDYRSLDVVESANSVIARDGDVCITTPYDNCILVMPTHGVLAGQTAVRLGREQVISRNADGY